jgi:hypothetical protein
MGESAGALIGLAGGSVTLIGRQGNASNSLSTLMIAPNTLRRDTWVAITETAFPPPKEYVDWSPVYEITPACFGTLPVMALRLAWGEQIGLGLPPNLAVYHARDRNGPWQPLFEPTVSASAHAIDVTISEFGLFFVGTPKTAQQMSCP